MLLIASVSKGSTIFHIISAAAPLSILEIVLALSLRRVSASARNAGDVGELHTCICGQAAALSNSRLNRMPLDPKSCDRINNFRTESGVIK